MLNELRNVQEISENLKKFSQYPEIKIIYENLQNTTTAKEVINWIKGSASKSDNKDKIDVFSNNTEALVIGAVLIHPETNDHAYFVGICKSVDPVASCLSLIGRFENDSRFSEQIIHYHHDFIKWGIFKKPDSQEK